MRLAIFSPYWNSLTAAQDALVSFSFDTLTILHKSRWVGSHIWSLTLCVSCDHIYLSTLGSTTAANVALAKAIRLAQELKLHDEGSEGVNTDRIELEIRRRLFWLLCSFHIISDPACPTSSAFAVC